MGKSLTSSVLCLYYLLVLILPESYFLVHSRRNKYVCTSPDPQDTQILEPQVQMEGMLSPGTEIAISKSSKPMTWHFEVAQEEPDWERIDGMVMLTVGHQQELVEVVAWKSQAWWQTERAIRSCG